MSQQLLDALKQQRRRRRLSFWIGFLSILLIGGLWAQLSKDPIGPDFINGRVFEAEEDVFFEEAPAVEVVTTTAVEVLEPPPDEPTETTVAQP